VTATEPQAAPASAGPSSVEEAALRIFDPAWKHDPYSSYDLLREEGAFVPGPFGLHLATRYAEIDAIMEDPAWSHAEEPKLLHPESDGSDLPASFLWMEPPDHTRLRRLVSKAFTARRVDGLRQQVEGVAAKLIDDVINAGEVDWVEQVAYPLPLTMITDMLGVPVEAHDLVRSMSYGIARGLDPDVMLSPEELANRARSAKAFKDYFGDLVVERRKNAKDDLISDLAAVEAEGERLTTDEMLSTLVVLVVAGHETTVNLIGNGLLSLMRWPDQYAALCADPELARPAIDEFMRYDGPSHFTTREATRRSCCWRRVTGTRWRMRTPTVSTSPGTRTATRFPATSASAWAATTASARRWCGWRWKPCCGRWRTGHRAWNCWPTRRPTGRTWWSADCKHFR
jgi:cytochrome P450